MREFGTDDGASLQRVASSYLTPQATTLTELNEQLSVVANEMHDRRDVLYIPELMAEVG